MGYLLIIVNEICNDIAYDYPSLSRVMKIHVLQLILRQFVEQKSSTVMSKSKKKQTRRPLTSRIFSVQTILAMTCFWGQV